MRQVGSAVRWLLLGLWLLALASGCASFSLGGSDKGEPRLSREQALARCIETTPQETVLYPDALTACMESHGWVYAVQGRR